MPKYKDMTYTIRKDGRIMKKVLINGKAKYLYSTKPQDLFKQYIEVKHLYYNGFSINTDVRLKDFANKWKFVLLKNIKHL